MIEKLTGITLPATKIKHHTGTYLVSFAVLSERFSFWGLQATLVLFLMQQFSQQEKTAFLIVGTFGALSYAFSLFGGMLADKVFGIWKACLWGLGLCMLGNIALIFATNLVRVNFGLACLLVGAGLFSPSSNNLIRALYEKKPTLKETGFLATCIAGNISGALAPLIYGIFSSKNAWSNAFLASTILNTLALLSFLYHSHEFSSLFHSDILKLHNSFWKKTVIIMGIVLIPTFFLTQLNWLNLLLLSSIPLISLLVMWLYHQLNSSERYQIGFVILLTAILLLFYSAVFQIYSSLTMFIAHYVERTFLAWQIPVPAFASLQCIFFILCAPIVNRIFNFIRHKGYEFSLLVKIQVGLVIGTIGFIFFSIAEQIARLKGYCGIEWIIVGNFFLGLGEVFLYPPILTAVATFTPKRWAGTLMGAFSISLALSSYFAGQLATLITTQWTPMNHISFLDLSYAKIVLFLTLVIIISTRVFIWLRQWYDNQQKIFDHTEQLS